MDINIEQIFKLCEEFGLERCVDGSGSTLYYRKVNNITVVFIIWKPFWRQLEITEEVSNFGRDVVTYHPGFGDDNTIHRDEEYLRSEYKLFCDSLDKNIKELKEKEIKYKLRKLEGDFKND